MSGQAHYFLCFTNLGEGLSLAMVWEKADEKGIINTHTCKYMYFFVVYWSVPYIWVISSE